MWLRRACFLAVLLATSCYARPRTLADIPPEYQPWVLYSRTGAYSAWLTIDSYWRAVGWDYLSFEPRLLCGNSLQVPNCGAGPLAPNRYLGTGPLTPEEKARVRRLVQFLPALGRSYWASGSPYPCGVSTVTAKVDTGYVTITVEDGAMIPGELDQLLIELEEIHASLGGPPGSS